MSTFESELENLLGEFHIKMKGELGIVGKVGASLSFLHANVSFMLRGLNLPV